MNKTRAREWVTVEKAADRTGLPASFFHERTGASGCWPDGPVWKWFEGRKMLDLQAVYGLIDTSTSKPSQRGRKRRFTAPVVAIPAP